MDLSEYATRVGMKAIYLIANIVLDILLKLAKDYKSHLERMDIKGEKPYVQRALHKVKAFIDKREINKIELENSQYKIDIAALDKRIKRYENIIDNYELSQEKEVLLRKLDKAKIQLEKFKEEVKTDEIPKIEEAINKYEERIEEIDTELEIIGINKKITEEKYDKALEMRKEALNDKDDKEAKLKHNLDLKSELKNEVEKLLSKEIKHTDKDLDIHKKELQEELDVINRKINDRNEKNKITPEQPKKQQEEVKNKTENQVKIEEIKEDSSREVELNNQEQQQLEKQKKIKKEQQINKKDEVKEEANKEKSIDSIEEGAKAKILEISTLEEGIKVIKDTYVKMKVLAIDNPELKLDTKYIEKFAKIEKLMEKYKIPKEVIKEKVKNISKEVAI